MKLETLINRHYFTTASDNYRAHHFNAPFIQAAQVSPVNYWPLILLFAAFILAGWTF